MDQSVLQEPKLVNTELDEDLEMIMMAMVNLVGFKALSKEDWISSDYTARRSPQLKFKRCSLVKCNMFLSSWY